MIIREYPSNMDFVTLKVYRPRTPDVGSASPFGRVSLYPWPGGYDSKPDGESSWCIGTVSGFKVIS